MPQWNSTLAQERAKVGHRRSEIAADLRRDTQIGALICAFARPGPGENLGPCVWGKAVGRWQPGIFDSLIAEKPGSSADIADGVRLGFTNDNE